MLDDIVHDGLMATREAALHLSTVVGCPIHRHRDTAPKSKRTVR